MDPWPEFPIPEGVKNLVETFYRLVDTESPDAFTQFSNIFTPTGKIIIGAKAVDGREGKSNPPTIAENFSAKR